MPTLAKIKKNMLKKFSQNRKKIVCVLLKSCYLEIMKRKNNQITITAAITFGICFANTVTASSYEEKYLKEAPRGEKTLVTEIVSHHPRSARVWSFNFDKDSEGNPLKGNTDVTPIWRLMNTLYYVNLRLPNGNFNSAKALLVTALSSCISSDTFGYVSAGDTIDGSVKYLNDMFAIRISPELDTMVVRGPVDLVVLPNRYTIGVKFDDYHSLYDVCLGMAKILNIEFAWNEEFGVYEFRPKNS